MNINKLGYAGGGKCPPLPHRADAYVYHDKKELLPSRQNSLLSSEDSLFHSCYKEEDKFGYSKMVVVRRIRTGRCHLEKHVRACARQYFQFPVDRFSCDTGLEQWKITHIQKWPILRRSSCFLFQIECYTSL